MNCITYAGQARESLSVLSSVSPPFVCKVWRAVAISSNMARFEILISLPDGLQVFAYHNIGVCAFSA
jgi:hypothetical protein